MSNIFIRDIQGSGAYAVPTDDVELAAATVGLAGLLGNVGALTYARVMAWVETQDGLPGVPRTLSCLVENFRFIGEECPDQFRVGTLTADIFSALLADPDISYVGSQQVGLFQVAPPQTVDLQEAYDNSTPGNPEIVIDANHGAVVFADHSPSLMQNIFMVTSNDEIDSYLAVGVEHVRVVNSVVAMGDAKDQGDANAMLEASQSYVDLADSVAVNIQAVWNSSVNGGGITGLEVNTQTYPKNPSDVTSQIAGIVGRCEHMGGARASQVIGVLGVAKTSDSGGIISDGSGVYARVTAHDGGDIINAHGVEVQIGALGGEIDSAVGVYVRDHQSFLGTIDKCVGMTIEAQTNGVTTNVNLLIGASSPPGGKWGIYSREDTTSYINGKLGIAEDTPKATFDVNGSIAVAEDILEASMSPYTILPGDATTTIFANALGGNVHVTLPLAGSSKGRIIIGKLIDTDGINQFWFDCQGLDQIDGKIDWHTSVIYNSVILQSDGHSHWWVIG